TACPISLETVSAAASARAAAVASRNLGCFQIPNATEQRAATPMFAKTCAAERPPRRSAVPRLSLRAYPKRVAAQVRTNTAHKPLKPAQPEPLSSAKQTTAPAAAPVFVTPRTSRPKTAKISVMTTAGQNFGGAAGVTAAAISRK